MKLSTDYVHDVVVININGELDSRGNQLLDKTLKDLGSNGNYKIVIDLSTIRFVGSQTISLLVSNLKEIRAGGGNIKFLNPQRAVMQYLKSNRIIELFECYSSKNEAVLSYDSGTKQEEQAAPPRSAPATRPQSAAQTAPKPAASTTAKPAQPAQPAPKPRQDPPKAAPPPAINPNSAISNVSELGENLQAGEVLYANSCILATIVKLLEKKGVLSSKEAEDLLSYDTD